MKKAWSKIVFRISLIAFLLIFLTFGLPLWIFDAKDTFIGIKDIVKESLKRVDAAIDEDESILEDDSTSNDEN